MEWINPHAWIHIDVTGPDGKAASWMVEGGSVNVLLRRGFTKKSLLPVGDFAPATSLRPLASQRPHARARFSLGSVAR